MADILPLLLRLLQLHHPPEASGLTIVPIEALLSELLTGPSLTSEIRASLDRLRDLEDISERATLRVLAEMFAPLQAPLDIPPERAAPLERACDILLALATVGRGAITRLSVPIGDAALLRMIQELRVEQEPGAPQLILVGGPFAQEVTVSLRGERAIERHTEIIYGDRSPYPQINASLLEIRRSRSRQHLRKPVIQLPGTGNTLELYSNKERKVGSIHTVEGPPHSLQGRVLTLSLPEDMRATLLTTSVHDDKGVLLSQVVRVVGRG